MLFERTSRSVRLAPAGELLLPRAGRSSPRSTAAERRSPRWRAWSPAGCGWAWWAARGGPPRPSSALWPRSTAGTRACRSPSGHRQPAHGGAGPRGGAGRGVRRAVRRPGPRRPRAPPAGRRAAGRRRPARPPAGGRAGGSGRAGRRRRLRRDAGRVGPAHQVDAAFTRAGVQRGVAFALRPPTRWCATSGWASGWLSCRARPRRPAGTRTSRVPLDDPAARHPVSLVHRRPEPSAPAARAFLRLLP